MRPLVAVIFVNLACVHFVRPSECERFFPIQTHMQAATRVGVKRAAACPNGPISREFVHVAGFRPIQSVWHSSECQWQATGIVQLSYSVMETKQLNSVCVALR